MKTSRVTDIYGEQIQVDGQWYHAQRVFGRAASDYAIGELVLELGQAHEPQSTPEPDEWVACDLFRESGANVTSADKIELFLAVMLEHQGWGPFPMVAGRVEVVTHDDVEQCMALHQSGHGHVWAVELAWSRPLAHQDVGKRYVHLENGHHRMHAALAATKRGLRIPVPVFDINREERGERFLRPSE